MYDYLVPEYFLHFDTDGLQGVNNPAGGVRTKIFNVGQALSDKGISLKSSVKSLRSHFVLVEPIFFEMGSESVYEEFCDYGGISIFYSTELQPLKWIGSYRDRLLDSFDYITYDCEYQKGLWEAMGITDMQQLTDPVDTELFRMENKLLQVIAVGRISPIKNSEFIRDLFLKLKSVKNVKTVYVGGATLWGNEIREDLLLEHEIRDVADTFVSNVPQSELAFYMGQSSFFVANNIHEVFSESHAESLSAGCVSVCGGHPLFKERPGVFVEPGVDETFGVLDSLTGGFVSLPERELFEQSRDWALKNVSYSVFKLQLHSILSDWLEVDSDGDIAGTSVFK